MNFKTIGSVLCLLASIGALTGCGSAQSSGTADYQLGDIPGALAYAESQQWDDIVSVLSDGEISAEEYRQVHEAYLKCNEALGWNYEASVIDPIGGLQLLEHSDYRGSNDATIDTFEECNQRFFNTVEAPYMSQNTQKMDPSLIAAVRVCLVSKGYSSPNAGVETRFQDFYPDGTMWADSDAPYTCTLANAKTLFPNLPAYGFGF